MPSTPPPLNPKPAKPQRDINQPLQVGEDFDIYKVVECSPDLLRCKVHSGCTLLIALASAVAAVALGLIWWTISRTTSETVYSNYGEKPLVWAFLAALLAIGSIMNLGKSLEINRALQRVRLTRFFFRTMEYSTHRLKAVRIEIKPPTISAPVTPPNQGNAQPPAAPAMATQAILSLVGEDDIGKPLEINLGDSNLHASSSWPTLAATAVQVSRMLRLPIRVEGAVDQTSESVRAQIQILHDMRV